MSKTVTVNVRYKSWYISLQNNNVKKQVLRRLRNVDGVGLFFLIPFGINVAVANLARF